MRIFLSIVASFIFLAIGRSVNAELTPVKEEETSADIKPVVNEKTEKKEEKKEESGFFSSVFGGDEKKDDKNKKVEVKTKQPEKEKNLIIKAQNISVEGTNKNNNTEIANTVKVKESGGDIYINIEPKINVSCSGSDCNKPCNKKNVKKLVPKKTKKTQVKKDEQIVKSKIPDPLEVYGDITEDDWMKEVKPKDFIYDIECLNKCKTKLNYNVSDQDIANLPLQDESQVILAPLLPEPDVVKIMEQPIKKVEEPVVEDSGTTEAEPAKEHSKELFKEKETQIIYKEQPEDLNVVTEIIIDDERINLIDNSTNNTVSTISNVNNSSIKKSTSAENYKGSGRAFAFVDNID